MEPPGGAGRWRARAPRRAGGGRGGTRPRGRRRLRCPPPPPGRAAGVRRYQPQPKGGSARTGPLPLHPMTLSDILDGAFNLFKAEARTIVLVTAAFLVPVQIVAAFLQRDYLGGPGFVSLFSDPSAAESALDSGSAGQGWATLVAGAATVLDPAVRGRGGEPDRVRRLPGRADDGRPGPAGGGVEVVGVHRGLDPRPPARGDRRSCCASCPGCW